MIPRQPLSRGGLVVYGPACDGLDMVLRAAALATDAVVVGAASWWQGDRVSHPQAVPVGRAVVVPDLDASYREDAEGFFRLLASATSGAGGGAVAACRSAYLQPLACALDHQMSVDEAHHALAIGDGLLLA